MPRLIALVCSLLQPFSIVKGQNYAVTDLGKLTDLPSQSQSRPNSINRLGTVAGANVVNGSYRALVYGISTTNLGTLGGGSSVGVGINASNLVVGYSLTSAGLDHAFLWTAGGTNGVAGNAQMLDLGTLGGSASEAYGINSQGRIAGYSATANDNNDHAFVYSNGVMKDIGTLLPGGLANSYGYGINDAGHIAGTAYNSSYSVAHAFFYNGTTATDIGTLGGTGALALGINNSDRVAGYATRNDGVQHAFRYAGGVMTDLGTLGGTYSYGVALNNSNVVVGGSFIDGGNSVYHAFICPSNTMFDLNSQLDASGNGWVLVEARAINDAGQVVGTGTYNGSQHAFLLNPAPRILQQPTNVQVSCAGTANFSVTASPAPLSFQWYKGTVSNGVPVANATNSTLTLTAVTGAQTGPYFAVCIGAFVSVTSAVATLTVLDSTAPALSGCPANMTKNTDPGLCSAIVTWPNPSALDGCDGPVPVVCSPPSGARFNKGVTVVTCRASDSSGNTNTCVFTVTVLDREAPTITNCPGPVTRFSAPGTTSVQVSWTPPTAIDNCDGVVPITSLPANGANFQLGTMTVVCKASDASGNTNSCSFDVTVVQAAPPYITRVQPIGTNIVLTFTTLDGGKYSVEALGGFPGSSWTNVLSGINGTGSLVSATNGVPSSLNSRFYRVKLAIP